jgi:hypothetical protein
LKEITMSGDRPITGCVKKVVKESNGNALPFEKWYLVAVSEQLPPDESVTVTLATGWPEKREPVPGEEIELTGVHRVTNQGYRATSAKPAP